MGEASKLTFEEHQARAALMGRDYYLEARAYCVTGVAWSDGSDGRVPSLIDRDTLEPLTWDDYELRFQKHRTLTGFNP